MKIAGLILIAAGIITLIIAAVYSFKNKITESIKEYHQLKTIREHEYTPPEKFQNIYTKQIINTDELKKRQSTAEARELLKRAEASAKEINKPKSSETAGLSSEPKETVSKKTNKQNVDSNTLEEKTEWLNSKPDSEEETTLLEENTELLSTESDSKDENSSEEETEVLQ